MSEPVEAVKHALSSHQMARIVRCGEAMQLRRQSGRVDDVSYWCRSRWCQRCELKYKQRVYAVSLDRLDEVYGVDGPGDRRPVPMLTVTCRHDGGLTVRRLRQAIRRTSDILRAAALRVHRHAYAVDRYIHYETEGVCEACRADGLDACDVRGEPRTDWHDECHNRLLPPVDHRTGEVRETTHTRDGRTIQWASTWQDETTTERPWGYPGGRPSYIWAREVTTGRDDAHWHVHFHIVCDSRGTAERLNAALQMERQSMWGDVAQDDYLQTDITAIDWQDGRNPATYLVKYISKGGVDQLDERDKRAYLRGIRSARMYDAAGDFRPLGIGRHVETDDPVVSVRVGAAETAADAFFRAEGLAWYYLDPKNGTSALLDAAGAESVGWSRLWFDLARDDASGPSWQSIEHFSQALRGGWSAWSTLTTDPKTGTVEAADTRADPKPPPD